MPGASESASQDKPAPGRLVFFRRHAGFLALLAVAAPLTFAFAWQDLLGSFGDDSVSYLTGANWFAGASGNPFSARWAAYHSHFPPLLPLLLWLTGGVSDFHKAYVLIAACAVASLPLIYRYAGRQLGSARAGLVVTLLFLFMPTAWISLKGILSEPLYLLTAMASLVFFEERLAEREGSAAERLLFGALLALACLARALGIALVLAYAAHCAMRAFRRRERPKVAELLPFVPVALLLALWYAARPAAEVDTYHRTAGRMIGAWLAEPSHMLSMGVDYFSSGWFASFMAEGAAASAGSAFVLALLGLLAVGGIALRVARNRLDGWFLLVSLAIIVPWVFSPENTRRLLYPLVPLLLVCAAQCLQWIAGHLQLGPRGRALAMATVIAADLAVSFPAMVLLGQKAHDREVVIPGYSYTYRDIADYYTTVNLQVARERAKLVVVTLAGLEAIDKVTPKGSRLMWMRPEYVGLLGRRDAVPMLYRWDAKAVAREVKKANVDYVVQAWLFKTDVTGEEGNPHVDTTAYAKPAFQIGDIFVLMQVDRAALDAYLEGGRKPG